MGYLSETRGSLTNSGFQLGFHMSAVQCVIDNISEHAPGTFSCHEALDRTALIQQLVDGLGKHQAILQNPVWRALAERATDSLQELYNEIATVHLGAA